MKLHFLDDIARNPLFIARNRSSRVSQIKNQKGLIENYKKINEIIKGKKN